MSASKISALTELSSPASGDLIPIVDVSDTTQAATGTTKKIQRSNLIPEFSPASSSGAESISLYEDTDNGTNKVTLIAPSSITSNKVITLPDATDTLIGKDTTDTLTNKTLTSPVLNGTLSGTGLTSTPLTTPKVTTSINDANGNEVIKTPATTSAVNEVTVTNAATGGAPEISATGGDTNIDLNLKGKGTGVVKNNGDAFINFSSTGAQSAFSTASTSFVDATGVTLTITPNKTVTVHAVCSGRWYVNTSNESIHISLLIDGVTKQTYDVKNSATATGVPFCVSGQASVASGSRVIKVQVKSAGGNTVNIDQSNLSIIWG